MISSKKSGIIRVQNDGWVLCPVCGKGKLLLTRKDTVVMRLDCKCKLCGRISEVNINAPEPESKETSA